MSEDCSPGVVENKHTRTSDQSLREEVNKVSACFPLYSIILATVSGPMCDHVTYVEPIRGLPWTYYSFLIRDSEMRLPAVISLTLWRGSIDSIREGTNNQEQSQVDMYVSSGGIRSYSSLSLCHSSFLKLSSVGLYYLHLEESQPKPVYFYINIYPPSFLLVSTLPNAYYEYSKLDKFIGKHSRHSYSRQTMKAVIGSGQEMSCFCVRLSDVILDSSQATVTELRSGTVIVKS